MIIYLGYRSPGTSCNLPGSFGRAALKRLPIWSCTRWGLPCLSCHHESGELLPRHFNLTCTRQRRVIGGVFSVALSPNCLRFALRTTVPCGVRTFLPGHEKAGRILIDEGHSEWEDTMRTFDTSWYGQASTYNYYCLRKFLENHYEVAVNMVEITPDILKNQDVVILKCATRAYAERELEALVSFVSKGGGLFVIGDHTDVFGTSTVLNPLAEIFIHPRNAGHSLIDIIAIGRPAPKAHDVAE